MDLTALPQNGTQNYLHRLTGVNARNVYQKDSQYFFVNINRGESRSSHGFTVVKLNGNTLQSVVTIDEGDTVLYEKMCIDGDYLYVAAHSNGIRIYQISNPESPVMAGLLQTGFIDAWAIAVDGDTAYVADGPAGLKIVDVSNKSTPVIVDGEDLDTAEGTYEDVLARDGRVYAAAGGAGVAVYFSAKKPIPINEQER